MTGAAQYLLAVYQLERRDGSPVAPGEIAAAVGRSNAATTEMLRELASNDWVTYEPYEGATLTPAGRVRGEELHDTYVTLAQFFDTVLDLDDPETEAMNLVDVVSETVAARLDETLLDHADAPPELETLVSAPSDGSS